MDFQLTDEQLQLKKSIREFAEREILPNVMKWDEASDFPLETIKELGRMGVLGIIFPAEYGGAGLGYVEYVIAIEELSRVDGSVGITVAAHNSLCSNHIFLAGNEAQKRKYVPKLASGEWLGAERHKNFYHQRTLCRRCRSDRRYGQDGEHAWALGVHRGKRHQGIPRRQKRKQVGAARQ